MHIDARGLPCPKPVLLAEDALSRIDNGIVEILVDNEASVGNLKKFSVSAGFFAEALSENGYWKLKIAKGYACDVSQPDAHEMKTGKHLLVVVASDSMGKDEALGKVLMKAYLDTMNVYREYPHTLFFMNSGVYLTTINDETVSVLEKMEKDGVEIFTCGTCLKHFGLENRLRVGFRGTTNHIVEGMKEFDKTVWIG